MTSLARLTLHASLVTVLLAALALPAAAADTVQGTVGAYRVYDSASDPSTLCAYPAGTSKLKQLWARGPRVDFPSTVGQVGWVEWRTSSSARPTQARGRPSARSPASGGP